ncbi:MAG: hypothetical protein VW985_00730 [Gammaproteobacteria bacterium]
MDSLLSFLNLEKFDLFHLRYGKGAVIIAVIKGRKYKNKINSDEYVARVYANGENNISLTNTPLDPIIAISEINGFIKISIEVKRVSIGKPSYRPINTVIDRILPENQVTLEIIRENEST